ncbi:lupus La protein [Cladophialophora psammophila CBS 110553]|uniref:Lupus La protein n=1 Tax=Cladophialophora psammophila CBS 110553 TaxID=1182543 RepID=W9XGL4_9EURO|nr:lupus La protein [Cladophialophora psammophila CBS 110553]EXJ69509.1 lupus La protein [Cladophialophora psammophila CBS 110553]
MSTEEAVTEALQTPVDQNTQAAEEAKKMLAELEGEAAFEDKPEKTNGVAESKPSEEEALKEPESIATKETADEGNDATEKNGERRDRGRSDYNSRGRGRGRGGHNNHDSRTYRDNIKSDLTTLEVTDDPVAIRKQVEFYFSDSNLPKDKFLFEQTGGVANKPVDLREIHKFKRMRRFQPFEAIVEALRDSKTLELTDDDTHVRRKEPLPENFFEALPQAADPRTVYVKGFGEESSSTQFDIEAFFDPYGPTRAVRLRRNNEKFFKGSVFVEFDTEELAQSFLALEPKPKFNGNDLLIMSKTEYTSKKTADLKAGKITSNNKYERGGRRDRHNHRGGRDGGKRKRDEDTRDWRTRRDEDQKRGFRDDKRRGDRGGRDNRGDRTKGPETDDRGIPMVKSTAVKNDSGREEALAKAKAAVEAENKKEQKAVDDVESTKLDGDADASSVQADTKAPAGKKRAREDDGDEADAERETKKVDVKSEAPRVNGDS